MRNYSKYLFGLFLSLSISLSAQDKGNIKFEGIFKGEYFPKAVYGLNPMKDGESYCKLEGKELNSYSFKTGNKIRTIVRQEDLITESDSSGINMRSFTFSPDETKILFATETEPIYRHSSRNTYYIYDIESKKIERLSHRGKQRVATFSPDSKKIAYILNNNLYYKNLETGQNVQITRDGRKNRIIYGTTDWVYEEEFSFIQGFHWSPDSKKIAFYRFDESHVKKYSFPQYNALYPEQYTYKYPKAGEDNSIVNIYVYDLEKHGNTMDHPAKYEKDASLIDPSGAGLPPTPPPPPSRLKQKAEAKRELANSKTKKQKNVLPDDPSGAGVALSNPAQRFKRKTRGLNATQMNIGEETDIYIPRIKWTQNSNQLVIEWLNRLQNELKFLLADATTGETKEIYHETNKYYIDITDNLYFLKDGNHFLLTSEKDGYNHIYLCDLQGGSPQQITKGKWEVTSFMGFDESKQIIYYISSESSPLNREMYSIGIDGKHKKKLSQKEGTNEVQWTPGFTYFINTYSSIDTPPQYTLCDHDGKIIRTLEDNSTFKEKILKDGFHPKEFFNFITSEGVKLNAWMLKPPHFDKNKKYPVLVYVYGGPGSQTVTNSWGYTQDFWFQYLAQNDFIIVSVDNRGTGARGQDFKKLTYRQLGKYETADQIEVAKYLSTKTFVNKNKIGIFGWSYGGYMASLCMTKGADYFNTGIAVAPVTNWRYYDNIYTERYMGLPQDNEEGYDKNAPLNHVDKLKGNFLLIHGTADDNVHFQNSMEMVKALTKANKKFEFMAYPNSNHGIYTGRNTRLHLYTKMTDFLFQHLK
jgi:dipeptidyl aminopeptidase/acylaminoacyl peptidase